MEPLTVPEGAPSAAATEAAVARWLDEVVIGLNLCPFAAGPRRKDQIRIAVCHPSDENDLTETLVEELDHLAATDPKVLETTLLAVEGLLSDFDDYRRFVDFAEVLVLQYGWEGVFQVASFHPDYQFADTEPDDPGNLTNRSPCPILHLIREESLARVLARYPDPDAIPATNIRRVSELTPEERARLFPYLLR
ncbi:MAG: DUF1415 domain-containing protein [Rhodocyclaceae bacterium]|nr:DUF1415 domain-containing protein [Rhodocyclaceae bacterium]